MQGARRAIAGRGFDVLEHPDLRPNHLLVAGPPHGLTDIGKWDAVAWVLPASNDLLVRRRVHVCAGPIDGGGGEAAAYTAAGHGWPDGAGIVALKVAFETLPLSVDANAARGEIERALAEWEKYGNVTIAPGGEVGAARTISIRFARAAHGDAYPFDGRGGMLAHTFYPSPPNSEPVAGDMHFDADEDWRIGAGVDLYTVALHEAGHALGLGHSDQPGAVMYPYYRQAFGLTSDDIAGIQALYGARGATTSPIPPPAPPAQPTPPPAPPPFTPSTPPSPPPSQPTTPPVTPATDRTPPAIRITSPATTTVTTSAATLTVSGTASDDVAVAAVRWSTSMGDAGDAAGAASWSATVPVYPGLTVITVRAYDAAGNSSWRSLSVTRR